MLKYKIKCNEGQNDRQCKSRRVNDVIPCKAHDCTGFVFPQHLVLSMNVPDTLI